jgi:AcrR family transcriptional regulator
MSPRKYEQKLRAESAEETRRRILDALAQRLREAPAETISVDRIAQMAGVARSTVYLTFGSRAGLFDALAEDIFERSGLPTITEGVAHPDARESLRGGLRAASERLSARRDVLRALYSMTEVDDEAVGGAVRRMEERRARSMAWLARRLSRQKALRPGLTQKDAANVLWLLTSFESFDALYTGRDLSVDKTAELLIETAEWAICGGTQSSGRARKSSVGR